MLLKRSLFPEGEEWFDPAFGRTGGEDSDFFRRQFARGHRFVWCDEAVVFEAVPPDRWTLRFHITRAWRSGAITGAASRRGIMEPIGRGRVLREIGYFVAGLPAAVAAAVLPRHLAIRVWQKVAYSAAFLGALGGLVTPPERS